MSFPLFPPAGSTGAREVDALYFALIAMSAFFLSLIFVPGLYFLYKYRRGNLADRRPFTLSPVRIELLWTVIPLLLALGLFAWGATIYFRIQVPPPDTLEINVVGKQWMWKIQHQEGVREIDELHLPVGRSIQLNLASEDVIHSFYIPAFRLKQDVVPGRFTTAWFHPTKVGAYHLFCAQYCGTGHSRMTGTIFVMEPEDYQAWLDRRRPPDTLAAAGGKLFRALGCSGCHLGEGRVRAPPLEGLYQRMVPLQGGEFVRADDRYLRDAILLPASQIPAGYEPLMPTFQGRITEGELFELIAYLKSLASPSVEKTP